MQKNGVLAVAIVALAIIAVGAYYFLSGGGGGGVSGEKLRQMVDQQIKELPPGVTASYKSIEGGTIKGVAVHWAYDKGAIDYTVDEIDLVNPNLDLAKALDAARADPKKLTKDTMIPVYDGATLKGVGIHLVAKEQDFETDGDGTVATINAKAFRLYPWALFQPGVPSLTELQAMLANPPSSPSLEAVMPMFRLAAAAGLAAAYDGGTMENLKVTIKAPAMPGAAAPQQITYDVKKLTDNGLDRGIIKGNSVEGIAMDMGPAGAVKIDRASSGGFDLRQAAGKVLSAQTLTPDMLDGSKIGKFEYTGVTVQPATNGAPPVKIGSFSISDIAFSGPVPVAGGFSLQGLAINKADMPDPQAKQAFDQLGLDKMTISMGAAYEWDLAKKSIKLHDVVVKVDELGALNLSADVSEITPDMAGAMGAQLVHAKLTFNDASLTDRAIKAAATMQHLDPTAFRKQMTGMVQVMSAQFTTNSPALAAASQAVTDFLTAPKSFSIELSPPKALPIMQLSMLAGGGVPPAQIATMVGLAVTANK